MTNKVRKPLELRPIKIEQGILGHHDGSASFSFGPVTALAAISGPNEVRIRDEKTDRSTIQIQFLPLNGISGTSSISFENSLQSIWQNILLIHQFPRSLIQIHLQTFSSPLNLKQFSIKNSNQKIPLNPPPIQSPHPDSPISISLKAAQINATTLACLDAAIPMRSLVAASSAIVIKKGIRSNFMRGWRAGESNTTKNEAEDEFEILLDPSPYEESLAKSLHVFAFSFERSEKDQQQESQLIFNESQGLQTTLEYFDCLALCRQASQDIINLMRDTMVNRLQGSTISSKGDNVIEDIAMTV